VPGGRARRESRRATSLSCNEPISPARRLVRNEDRERIVRFLATRFRNEPSTPGKAARSRSAHQILRNAPAPAVRGGGGEVAGSRFGRYGCSELAVGRSNESLKRTSADGLTCAWLARSVRISHLLAWRAVARRLALR
jgi:hypothetical protein